MLIFLTGCSLVHDGRAISEQIEGGSIVPENAARIYIRPLAAGKQGEDFKNEYMRRLKRAINLDGRLAVVGAENKADLVLDAPPVRYAEENVKFDVTGRPVVRRISITLSVTLADRQRGRLLIKDKEKDLFTEYNPDSAIINEVQRELADRASAAVLSIILTGWAGRETGGRAGI